jgi:phospholipid/cholesterol/gamma-HCH transport system permease protein
MRYNNPHIVEHVGDAAWRLGKDCVEMLSFVGELSAAIAYAATHPRKVRWKETFYYMDMCGSDALPIVTLICFLMGLILGFQAAVQMHKFGTDIYVADLVGFSIVKELGPLMVAMIATGRAGSAFAAEIGTMKVSEEIDAMLTMGFVPSRFLVIPKVLAMVCVIPVLTVFGDISGIVGGFFVGWLKLGLPPVAYFDRTFAVLTPMTFVMGLAKSFVFAFLIATVGCMRGFEAGSDAQGVGRSATSAVVSGIFLIVIADAVLTILFTTMGY